MFVQTSSDPQKYERNRLYREAIYDSRDSVVLFVFNDKREALQLAQEIRNWREAVINVANHSEWDRELEYFRIEKRMKLKRSRVKYSYSANGYTVSINKIKRKKEV